MSQDIIDWARAKNIVLQRLQANFGNMSKTMQNLPTMPYERDMEVILISPADALFEVQNLSEIGKQIIKKEMAKIAQLQPK